MTVWTWDQLTVAVAACVVAAMAAYGLGFVDGINQGIKSTLRKEDDHGSAKATEAVDRS